VSIGILERRPLWADRTIPLGYRANEAIKINGLFKMLPVPGINWFFCFQVQKIELKTENFLPRWPAGADRWEYSTSTMLRSHKSTRWTKWAKVTLKTPFSFNLRLWFYVISTRTSRHRDEFERGERWLNSLVVDEDMLCLTMIRWWAYSRYALLFYSRPQIALL
jgi:hypothetical protein